MSNYGWTNEAGEPIMDGAAYRFEQQLDEDSRFDYYADHFYDEYPEVEPCDYCDEWPEDCVCGDDAVVEDAEDAWLDGSYEE